MRVYYLLQVLIKLLVVVLLYKLSCDLYQAPLVRQRVVLHLRLGEEECDIVRKTEIVHQISQRVAQLVQQFLLILLLKRVEQLVYLCLQFVFGLLISARFALVQHLVRNIRVLEVRTPILLQALVLSG